MIGTPVLALSIATLPNCSNESQSSPVTAAPHEHAASAATAATAAPLDAAAIGRAAGAEPKTTPDGVVRLSFPRSDVSVTVDGVSMRPYAGLSAWAAFEP